jgi:hypothetical protein
MTALKPAAFIVGVALLGATAHVTIHHTGGYGSAHAILTLAIAAGVGIGALCVGAAWASQRAGVATWLVMAILAGEAFGFLSTAERLVVAREAMQAPLRVAQEAFDKARARASAAAQAIGALPPTSPRLEAAQATKAVADAAVVAKSAERGCVENCRRLLQAQVDAAALEVDSARAEVDARRKGADAELVAARAAMDSLQPPVSATPLADRLGVPAWLLDLLTAGLGSIAANGLACGLIAFAAHHGLQPTVHRIKAVIPMRPSEHAARFAVETLRLGGQIEIAALPSAYRRWCVEKGCAPLPDDQVAPALAQLFERAGILIARNDGRLIAVGISLDGSSESRTLVTLCNPI